MKYKTILLFSVMALVLAASAFAVGNAYATTGCFNDTNGHWAETFICWMKDNGITGGYPDGGYHPNSSVTRAEMAVFMRALRTTGDTYINAGPSNWVPNGAGTHYVTYYTNVVYLRHTGAGSVWFNAMPSIPSSILNAKMYFKGVKVCYDATHGASISNIEVRHFGSSGSILNEVTSTTTRTDSTCVTLNFTSAISLWGGEWGSVAVLVNFPSAAEYVYIRGVTFIISPSAEPAVLGPVNGLRPDVEVPAVISSGSENP
ncbi:MAG: S-layer homology domain-containing protein [Chloroflexi bacterium]|nr:S-layer homology domain-containing protein [Chloroflexota bacterium]